MRTRGHRGVLLPLVSVALLACTPQGASAASVSPTSYDFGAQTAGTSSEPHGFVLTVYCNVPDFEGIGCLAGEFLAPSIAASGPFSVQGTDCPAVLFTTINFPMSCSILVSFRPTAAGTATGTLSTGGPMAELRGTGLAAPVVPPPPPPPPSNAFSFGKAKLNRKKGTAILPVKVPGRGTLTLAGKNIALPRSAAGPVAAGVVVKAAGEVGLRIKAKGAAKDRLERTGKATVQAKVTFTPSGGTAASQTTPVRLRKTS